MRVALDTNVLLRYLSRADPHNHAVVRHLKNLSDKQAILVIAPQILYELWVDATRPTGVNVLGLSPHQVRALAETARPSFDVLPDPVDLVGRWLELCTINSISGKRAHDARIVAWMQCHDVETLLTFDARHFALFGDLKFEMPA